MSGAVIVTIVVVLVVLAVVAALASRMVARGSAERRSFGPEYARLVEQAGARNANAEYAKRRRRVDGLGITPLRDERRTRYNTQWVAAQVTFIDNPVEAVRSAAALVTAVAADRGYEVSDSGQLLTDLSVDYGNQLDGYRSALTVSRAAGDPGTHAAPGTAAITGTATAAITGTATAAITGTGTGTEELRRALLGYRAMFRALAGISDDLPAGSIREDKHHEAATR